MPQLIDATDREVWNAKLARIGEVDATCLAAYHLAYALRVPQSRAVLWHYSLEGQELVYPFLLTPVILGGVDTGLFDISSAYGYTGPLATTQAPDFLQQAWQAFDTFAVERNLVAEFIRFSPFNRNEHLAHPLTTVLPNRDLAVTHLPSNEVALRGTLGPKTRNMLRKAEREGLVHRELPLPDHLPAFRALYEETMRRNNAPEFFWYDDAYWNHLLALGSHGLRLFGVYAGPQLVAAAMAVAHGRSGLYHLGASLTEYAKLGAGNLSLYAMSCGLMASGVTFLNMTGGRSARADDPLLLFKRSNANSTAVFHIGKRVLNIAAYNGLSAQWQRQHGHEPDADKIIFWRK